MVRARMTPADLRDQRAAHAARTHYQNAAERLGEAAISLRQRGFGTMSRQVARWANVAQRAARAEYEASER